MKLGKRELERFRAHLQEGESSAATVEKYLRDVRQLAIFCGGELKSKGQLVAFKEDLQRRGYAPGSVNSMLAAVNRFLRFAGKSAWKLRFLKVQRRTFVGRERQLTQGDYEKLVRAAKEKGDLRLAMLLQTICATGIRVSETGAVTVESVRRGRAEIRSKGKIRVILLPRALCRELARYCEARGIDSGPVFVTRSGRTLDRSNIWKMMKRLALQAKVSAKRVFPHNLRHLFARTYYKRTRDIVHLADILGHSSVNTTRIYTTRDAREQRRQLDSLCLLI